MKKIRCYLPNVLLTFLLVFLLIGCEVTVLASRIALNPTTFQYISDRQQLDAKGYDTLTTYFKTRSNSTGIPESVFLNAFSQSDLRDGIWSNAGNALMYVNWQTNTYTPSLDFTRLEDAVRTFFEEYADENGFPKDDVLEEKIQSTCKEAEASILNAADPFKFSTLHSNGWLAKFRTVVSWLNTAIIGCIGGLILVLFLLFLCNLKQLEHLCYWVGLAGFTAGGLMAAPCIYLTATDYYSGFAIKDPQIFSAVIGYLKLLTSRCLTMAIVTVIVGCIGILCFIFLHALQKEEQAA